MIALLKKWRCALLVFCTHSVALPAIRLLQQVKKFPYNTAQLGEMPDSSGGALLLQFLHRHNLHLLPDYESHDIKHALLGYPATEEGEASLQYFFYGNGQRSFPVLITVLVTFVIMPEYHAAFRKAYRRGLATPRLGGVDWFGMLPQPAEDIRQQLQIPPL